MIKMISILFVLMSLSSAAFAEWKIDYVYDGDTIKLLNDEYIPPFNKIGLRIMGIDTPEKGGRAKCDIEREQGAQATEFFKQLIDDADKIELVFFKWGKYGGRVLGDIIIDGKLYSIMAIKEGIARPYDGKKRKSWCPVGLGQI